MHVRHGLSNAVCGVQAAVPVGQQLDLLARAIVGRFYSARWLGAGLWDDPADGAGSAQKKWVRYRSTGSQTATATRAAWARLHRVARAKARIDLSQNTA